MASLTVARRVASASTISYRVAATRNKNLTAPQPLCAMAREFSTTASLSYKQKRTCPLDGRLPDYKNVGELSQFVSDQTGQILPATVTGFCAKCQRKVAKAIKRARTFGLMPYTYKLEIYSADEGKTKKDPRAQA